MSELDDAKAEIKRLCKGELMLDLAFTEHMCAALNRPLSSGFSVNDVTEYVKGLEADAKRLNWLGANCNGEPYWEIINYSHGYGLSLVTHVGGGPGKYYILREAIDAAMKDPAK